MSELFIFITEYYTGGGKEKEEEEEEEEKKKKNEEEEEEEEEIDGMIGKYGKKIPTVILVVIIMIMRIMRGEERKGCTMRRDDKKKSHQPTFALFFVAVPVPSSPVQSPSYFVF